MPNDHYRCYDMVKGFGAFTEFENLNSAHTPDYIGFVLLILEPIWCV